MKTKFHLILTSVMIAIIINACNFAPKSPIDSFNKMIKAAEAKDSVEFKKYILKNIEKPIPNESLKQLSMMKPLQEQIEGDKGYLIVEETKYFQYKWLCEKKDGIWKFTLDAEPYNHPLEISAPDLNQAFTDNQIQAEKNYKGKVLTVTGVVRQIQKEITGKYPLVTIGTGFVGDVNCQLLKEYEDKAAELKKGDEVRITGICDGFLMLVLMKDCAI